MKLLKLLTTTLVATAFALNVSAAEDKKTEKTKEKAKPYTLKTCVVTDEKLDSMGEPYVFTHAGQEVKLCCKSCLKDFNKDTAKYIKKIEADKSGKKAK